MDTDTGHARPAARLTILSARSGVGGRRVVALVRARTPGVWVPVPTTTRPRRHGEVDGIDYHFTDPARFQRMVETGQLLDWVEFEGHRYGIARAPVLDRLETGTPVLLPRDAVGARRVQAVLPAQVRARARLVCLVRPDRLTGQPVPEPALRGLPCLTLVADSLERVVNDLVGLLGLSDISRDAHVAP